jgi:tetratricopeptide (TPR) repeat protein
MWTVHLQAENPQIDFMRANQAYSEDKFPEAASIFDSLIKNQGGSPELYYNLGNALACSGDAGRAVLAYERGLLLNPRDAEIKANLEKIRQKNNLYDKPAPFWEQPFFMIGQNTWAAGFLISCWMVALGSLVWALFRKKLKKAILLVFTGSGVLFALIGLLALAGSLVHGKDSDAAVVITPDLPLLISPFAGATISTSLKSGEVIHAGETHGDYIYVRNDEGKNGWVRARDIEKVQ